MYICVLLITTHIMRKEFKDSLMEQREIDGYVNATKILSYHNKQSKIQKVLGEYFRTNNTKRTINYLASKINVKSKSLYIASRGRNGSTWMHPILIIDFASWLCPSFGVSFQREYDAELNFAYLSRKQDNTPYKQIELFDNIILALDASESNTTNNRGYCKEFPINGSKYRVDFIIWDKNLINSDNAIKLFIIEYDENHHNSPIRSSEDAKREYNIFNRLYALYSRNFQYVDITILRIKEGQEGYVYTYLIPYITHIETSHTMSKLYDHFDYRIIVSEELNINLLNESGTYFKT